MRLQTLAFLSLVPALAAQTTLSMVSATPIAAATSQAGGVATLQGIGQNATIGSSPNNVFLMTSQSPAGAYLSATTICYPTLPYQGGIGFNFFERAYARGTANDLAGSSASTSSTGVAFGPHAVLATFAAAPGTVGHVVVSWRTSSGTTGVKSARVDIDDDGVPEVSQSAAQEFSFPYTIGPSGTLVVRASNECASSGNGTSSTIYTWTEMWVGFMPDLTANCTITTYGQGCGGVAATGADAVNGSTRTLTVSATGCYPNSPALVATGSQQISLPLLLGCTLLCNAEGVAVVAADGNGDAAATWNIPATVVGTTHVQILPLTVLNGALALSASNGVRIVCTH
ncbi:MAG: hypothetical protein U1E73_03430 [Planctomycetota bacterium]